MFWRAFGVFIINIIIEKGRQTYMLSMAIAKGFFSFILFFLLNGLAAGDVQVITTENFTVVLEGEWMVEL